MIGTHRISGHYYGHLLFDTIDRIIINFDSNDSPLRQTGTRASLPVVMILLHGALEPDMNLIGTNTK